VKLALAVLLAAGAGCTFHLRRDAPGHAAPLLPPAAIERQGVEAPGDPGEGVAMFTAGGYIGGGFRAAADQDARGVVEGGAEIGFHLAESDTSHEAPLLFPVPHVWPERTWGGNAGLSLVSPDGEQLQARRLFLEAQRGYRFWGLAAGYGVDLATGDHGPHATAWLASYYLRAQLDTDGGATLLIGFFLKLLTAFVWSR
jgi:hypothetical protein